MNRLLAIGVLCLLVIGDGEASPIPSKDKPQQAPQSQPATNAYQSITEASPLFVKIEPSESLQEKAADKASSEDRDAWDRWMAEATIGLAFITTMLAIFTGGLWYHTYKLAKGAEEASKTQITDMRKSLEIAEKSAESTKRMVETMKNNAAIELRAYVTILHDSVPNPHRPPNTFSVCLKNTGRTPAYHVKCHITWEFFPGEDVLWPKPEPFKTAEEIEAEGESEGSSSSTLGAEMPATFDCPMGNKGTVTFDAARSMGLRQEATIFVYGEIRYDTFGEDRATEFCFASIRLDNTDRGVPGLSFAAYSDHNHAN
jgi:hypothetical protein